MEAVILGLVLIAILLAVASGLWVSVALVRAISSRPAVPAEKASAEDES
ncbi:MAG: hypothetical protein ACYSR6_00555 [Planctomycetota bacterium]|jgi:hypothetical protein